MAFSSVWNFFHPLTPLQCQDLEALKDIPLNISDVNIKPHDIPSIWNLKGSFDIVSPEFPNTAGNMEHPEGALGLDSTPTTIHSSGQCNLHFHSHNPQTANGISVDWVTKPKGLAISNFTSLDQTKPMILKPPTIQSENGVTNYLFSHPANLKDCTLSFLPDDNNCVQLGSVIILE